MKLVGPNPSGLCMCGCGGKTKISPKDDRQAGHVKGKPKLFLLGHQPGRPGPEYEVDAETGCWLWLRYTRHGYGITRRDGKRLSAHRMVYEREVGPVPEGLELDHLCRVKRCVNPDHLEPVTHAENSRRAIAKLTMEDANEIRRSDESAAVLAVRFGVAKETIQSVRQGVSWVAA